MNRYLVRLDEQEWRVGEREMTIGRLSACAITVHGALVSRRHARLWTDAAGLHVQDLDSRNGVRVNGRRVRHDTLVRHGDRLAIGLTVLLVLDASMIDLPETATTLPPPLMPAGGGNDGGESTTAVMRMSKLSEREREVYELILQGHTLRAIGKRLYLSVKTIETYRTRIGEKMGCRTRAELMHAAVSAGLLSQPRLPSERSLGLH